MARRAPGSWKAQAEKKICWEKNVHQDIECQAFCRALSVTKGPYNSEGRQVCARYGWDGSMASGNEAALCQNGIMLLSGC